MRRHLTSDRQRYNVRLIENVLAILYDARGRPVRSIKGKNIITNEGDLYYAQKAAGESPTTDFPSGGLRLGSSTTTPAKADTDVGTFIASTGKAVSASYPQTNDGDGDNSGAGTDIITWKFSYTTGDFNASGIAEGAVVDDTGTPTKVLAHLLFASSFPKTGADTLVIYVNHIFHGS